MAPVTEVRNVGPAVADALTKAGVLTAEDLRSMGADRAYARMLRAGTRPHFIVYYSLVLGLQGRPWNDAQGPEKEALRARFDDLVSTARNAQPLPGDLPRQLAEALDHLGVRPKGR